MKLILPKNPSTILFSTVLSGYLPVCHLLKCFACRNPRVSNTPSIASAAAVSYTLTTIPRLLVSTTPALQFVCTGLQNTSALNQSGEQNHAVSCSTCNMSEYSYNSLMLQNMMAKVYYSYDSLVNVCLQKGKGFTHTETWAFIVSVSYFNPLPFPAYKVSAF